MTRHVQYKSVDLGAISVSVTRTAEEIGSIGEECVKGEILRKLSVGILGQVLKLSGLYRCSSSGGADTKIHLCLDRNCPVYISELVADPEGVRGGCCSTPL